MRSPRFGISILDGFEAGYSREKVPVEVAGSTLDGAWIYIAEKESCPPLPSMDYKRIILEGAQYWRLPENYVASLELIETARD